MSAMPSAREPVEHRGDHRDLLAAHGAALAGVRVEPGDGDARRGDAEVGDRARAWVMRSVASRSSGVSAARHRGERDVDRSPAPRAARGRPASSPAAARRRGGRGTRCGRGRRSRRRPSAPSCGSGWCRARAPRPLADQLDAAGDDRDDRRGVRRVGAARRRRAGQRMRQHRQARRPSPPPLPSGACDRRGPARRAGAPSAGHVVEVADQEERQAARGARPRP